MFHHAVIFEAMKLQAVVTTTFVSPLYWKGLLGVVTNSYKELEFVVFKKTSAHCVFEK